MHLKDKLIISYRLFTVRGRINRSTYWLISLFIWSSFYVSYLLLRDTVSENAIYILYPLLLSCLLAKAVKRLQRVGVRRFNIQRFINLHNMTSAAYTVALLLLISCSTKEKESALTTTSSIHSPIKTTPAQTTIATAERPKPSQNAITNVGKWLYEKRVDKEGHTVYKAMTRSPTLLKTAFPYTGHSTATLTIRKRATGDTHLYIQLANGQFNRSFQGGQARVRFDKDASTLYTFSAAENGSANIIFFDATQALIRKVKAAQTMRVDVDFAGLGYQQIEFKTSGLSWNH